MSTGDDPSTPTPCTVGPLTDDQIRDLICAYLGNPNAEGDPRNFSEGYLRDLLWETNRLNLNQVRALWFDAIERGHAISEQYKSWLDSEVEKSGGPQEYYAKRLAELRSKSQANGS
jgi:hypothetical protein